MNKKRKALFKKLAKKALKHRWLPIFSAKTIEGMRRIYKNTSCGFCLATPEDDCDDCPLDVGDGGCCDGAWFYYEIAVNLSEARLNAGKIVTLLQEIADWEV